MRTGDFNYELPSELIAQEPAPQRDQSRLLVLSRSTQVIAHRTFRDLPEYVNPGDLLVLNNSKVLPARLRARKLGWESELEILLLEENRTNDWWAMLRPGKRVRPGNHLVLLDAAHQPTLTQAILLEKNAEGHCRLQFTSEADIIDQLESIGEVPLPPYISRNTATMAANDRERYQTIFARSSGSIAAPTAGLHFTQPLLEEIQQRGARICFVTLHVGFGTFAPVRAERLSDHVMHPERFESSAQTAQAVHCAREAGHRVVAVGSTTLRVLESVAAENQGQVVAARGRTRLFIYPPYHFQAVDALLTNFHLPKSTLLMLVSAFAAPDKLCGRERVLAAYAEAIRERYRFYSYGDAMLIL